MLNYEQLSENIKSLMNKEKENNTFNHLAFDNNKALRRFEDHKTMPSFMSIPFLQDIFTIMQCPYYSRYADKTQVFSLYKNDDITRRGLHVQLVSKIARTIGSALNLNLELIEAIALGHDIGHPPFAHNGESYLDKLSMERIGKHFSHNIHSVRVLDKIFPYNLTLQTLNGIASHNGEVELEKCTPRKLNDFETFDKDMEKSYISKGYANMVEPDTMEASVVRISDIIAYLGKDRQDALKTGCIYKSDLKCNDLGETNEELMNNLIINIIEHSYGKPYIMMDHQHFTALKEAKKENYALIYLNEKKEALLNGTVKPMMKEIYDKLYDDLVNNRLESPVYTHHIAYINKANGPSVEPYENNEPNQIVIDYIASMTDDYFIDLHKYLFPDSKLNAEYKGYFDID